MEAVDVFVLEREVADLRAKLAAAEQISQKYENRYVSERKSAEDFRATVADALVKLLAEINSANQASPRAGDTSWRDALNYSRLGLLSVCDNLGLDTTIAALGINTNED